ncbi:MAG: T9SS type A sorting domain-containing protein, partial [Candidatus Marinimicrobia bacterium]|nr:T9SS type A sorting domain-containing protein [Candidatus Neomarinimicrobiota bacterium]
AAITESETVLLSWKENDDAYLDRDLAHYAIYRSEGSDFTLLATTEAVEFSDETVTSGIIYEYYVTAVDFSENESVASAIVTPDVVAIDLTASLPESFKLSQNYPNPFNPETAIEFALPENAFVKLTIFNILGQEVRSLTSSHMEAGVYRVVWNGRDNNGHELTSGTYIYRIQAGKYSKTMKMAYIK